MKLKGKIKETSRRTFIKNTVLTSAAVLSAPYIARSKDIEILHWSWLGASDAAVWKSCIDDFNKAHKGKGVQIRMETVPNEQYDTKLLASAATGRAPDFGWQWTGSKAKWAADGVIIPMDKYIKDSGLDLADFSSNSLDKCRYPQVDKDRLFWNRN